jgi:hypothetical protein
MAEGAARLAALGLLCALGLLGLTDAEHAGEGLRVSITGTKPATTRNLAALAHTEQARAGRRESNPANDSRSTCSVYTDAYCPIGDRVKSGPSMPLSDEGSKNGGHGTVQGKGSFPESCINQSKEVCVDGLCEVKWDNGESGSAYFVGLSYFVDGPSIYDLWTAPHLAISMTLFNRTRFDWWVSEHKQIGFAQTSNDHIFTHSLARVMGT